MGINPTMLKQIIRHNKGLPFTEVDVDYLIPKYGSSLAYQSSRAQHKRKNVKLPLYDEIPDKVIFVLRAIYSMCEPVV